MHNGPQCASTPLYPTPRQAKPPGTARRLFLCPVPGIEPVPMPLPPPPAKRGARLSSDVIDLSARRAPAGSSTAPVPAPKPSLQKPALTSPAVALAQAAQPQQRRQRIHRLDLVGVHRQAVRAEGGRYVVLPGHHRHRLGRRPRKIGRIRCERSDVVAAPRHRNVQQEHVGRRVAADHRQHLAKQVVVRQQRGGDVHRVHRGGIAG